MPSCSSRRLGGNIGQTIWPQVQRLSQTIPAVPSVVLLSVAAIMLQPLSIIMSRMANRTGRAQRRRPGLQASHETGHDDDYLISDSTGETLITVARRLERRPSTKIRKHEPCVIEILSCHFECIKPEECWLSY